MFIWSKFLDLCEKMYLCIFMVGNKTLNIFNKMRNRITGLFMSSRFQFFHNRNKILLLRGLSFQKPSTQFART